MKKSNLLEKGSIPISLNIEDAIESIPNHHSEHVSMKRTMYIASLALFNALVVSGIAKLLLFLINFVTNLSFFGKFSIETTAITEHKLGAWVILLPIVGGLVVGLMAKYGSKAIRGHGIPEAMEKILNDDSKIPPHITFLKPLSAAISIGTGGPFGAEGPIIATGGALGSFCGQTLRITVHERKILLAAGATAGMTAIFGTPFAAILLAIELLLFEFSPKSFVPVVVSCVTGACMHYLFFETGPTFPMPAVGIADKNAIITYACIGLIIGFFSIIATKAIYLLEDGFEKLPIHWMWWPAIGGVAVGVVGYFYPETLGVGYENITHALSGKLAIAALISLCFWKFMSWSIALGSGTSGGTLAPLLTIGSAIGCLLGLGIAHYIPQSHISIPLAALVGMAALFAGASRALLTSIVFAMEATGQENTLLPLLAGCTASYIISFLFMRTTIMTEKISRRGIIAPDSYVPNMLQMVQVRTVMIEAGTPDEPKLINEKDTISDVKEWLASKEGLNYTHDTLFIVDQDNNSLLGSITRNVLMEHYNDNNKQISEIEIRKVYSVFDENNLQVAAHFITKTKQDILPVVNKDDNAVIGFVSKNDILSIYNKDYTDTYQKERLISKKRTALRIVATGKKLLKH